MTGIYKIQSFSKPERCYIGSAVNIGRRWAQHLSDLHLNKHHASKLQNHCNKYGIADLCFSVLLCGCEKEDLIFIEQLFLDSYNPCFNSLRTAGSMLGYKFPEEVKNKLKSRPHQKWSEESKNKLRGRKLSQSHRNNLKRSWKTRPPFTEKTKQKMREFKTKWWAEKKK